MPHHPVYRQLPLPFPALDRADPLAAARVALAAADHADRRATTALAAQLATVARARGRNPIAKPGRSTHREPPATPDRPGRADPGLLTGVRRFSAPPGSARSRRSGAEFV